MIVFMIKSALSCQKTNYHHNTDLLRITQE